MKVTLEISGALLRLAREVAAREGTTLSALVKEGLRRALAERQRPPFRLRDASFRGRGLQPEFRDADWSTILSASYGTRAGEHE